MSSVLDWQFMGVGLSRRLAIVMLLLLLQGAVCMTKAISAGSAARWESPCSGSRASRASVPYTAPLGIIPVNQQHHAISQQALDARLQYLQPLLGTYETRFGLDQTSLRDLASQMETQMFGSLQRNYTSPSSSNRLATLLKGYNDLSHLAVYMEQVVADQQQLSTQHQDHLVLIDELGVYWILCAMKRLTTELGEPAKTQHSRDTMPEEYRQNTSQASQQVRDYTILRNLEMLLRRIEMENRMLASAEPLRRRRRHSSDITRRLNRALRIW